MSPSWLQKVRASAPIQTSMPPSADLYQTGQDRNQFAALTMPNYSAPDSWGENTEPQYETVDDWSTVPAGRNHTSQESTEDDGFSVRNAVEEKW